MRSTTFKVAAVSISKDRLPDVTPKQAIECQTNRVTEACSSYRGRLLATSGAHPLFAAAHLAFARHRPLVLTPDVIWLTIASGFATHVQQNAEKLRRHFVQHEGQVTLQVRRDDFVKGSPENPWSEVFAEFSEQIAAHIGDETHRGLRADFSTTGPVERAASNVLLMASVQSYLKYELMTLCGIPEITLKGEVDDWKRLQAQVAGLARFDLEWWTAPLARITAELVSAAEGRPSPSFWDSLYKFQDGSGGPYITGWIAWFLPYIERWDFSKDWKNPSASLVRNPDLGQIGTITESDLPAGLSAVPFLWTYLGESLEYELLAGLVGVREDPDSLAVEPVAGWAVRPRSAPKLKNAPKLGK